MSAETQGPRGPRLALQILAGVLLFSVGASVASRVFEWTLHAYVIPSSAMEPTLHCARPNPGCEAGAEDRVLVARFHPFWTPRRGDIVVFETPPAAKAKCGAGGRFTKRIIGLPGETVRIRLHGGSAYVYVDGRRLREPYVEQSRRDLGPAEVYRVPPGSYFVLGDNRSQSCDSRVWGAVPSSNLLGPVVTRYWPLARIGRP
jgi:signal peptidase I